MNSDRLGKFLNGDTDDEEFQRCETWLEEGQTIVEENAVDRSEPLIASLRAAGFGLADEDDCSRQLVERIGGIISQHLISREEIARLLDPPQQPDELGRIGRYRVIEFIDAGGMGLVFKAEDSHLNRLVCIKIMHPSLALKPDARLRFERESRAAAQLRSERIVTLLDIGVQRELPYIVMQLLDGESLRSKLSREGKLTAQRTVHYLIQIAEGLRHAHSMGILHRDIKPDNVWVTGNGDVKLLDFGLARPIEDSGNLTTTGGLIGTPQYMSPEQVQGQTLDARSDLFSVGIVLFEMLTGTLPFQKNNLFSTMIAITNDSVHLPALESSSEVVRGLENVLQRLLKKNPNERIQSAQELMDLLSRVGSNSAETDAAMATVTTLPLASAGRGHANHWRYVLVGLCGGLLAALLFMLVMQTTDKGTLLVRTNDPQVDIRIAEEKVHVKDPLSGKSFEIQIGKTRLPGGVYQLEMSDATNGLTFSSKTIVIRRGETVIVEVELQPSTQVATNDKTNSPSEKDDKPSTSKSSDLKTSEKNADPSFDEKRREEFARTLANLPAQSINILASSRRGDSLASFNAGQTALVGIDYWSIDTDTFDDRGVVSNCDRTLLATVRDNTAQIWDPSLKLKYTLQSSHAIWRLHFDNKYPNLIAASSYVGDRNESKPTKEPSYEITLWRLGSNYAEMIYRLPCHGYQFAWDQGYRLFHQGQEGLAVFRLDENKHYELHIPRRDLMENAISSSGRFVASRNGKNIDVWDLHRGEFAFTSLDNSRVQWDRQGERAAFFSGQRTAFEIWDLETRAIADRIELPSEPVSQFNQGQKMAVIELEPTFQRVAWLSLQGKLSVRNLRNNREHSQTLPSLGTSEIEAASLQWEGSSLIIETDQASYVWTHDQSDVEGTPEVRKPSPIMARKQGVPLKISFAAGSSMPVIMWHDPVATDRNRAHARHPRDRQPEMYFDAFDTVSNRLVHDTPFNQLENAYYLSQDDNNAVDLFGPPFASLDGRYATSTSGTLTFDTLLFVFADAKSTRKLDLYSSLPQFRQTTAYWDKSSRFAMVGIDRPDFKQQKLRIYDTETMAFVDQSKAILSGGSIVDIQCTKNGFVVINRLAAPVRSPTPGPKTIPPKYAGDLEVWRVDPATPQIVKAEAATTLLARLGTVDSIVATDAYLFVSKYETLDSSETSARVGKYYRIALVEETDSHVECVTVPLIDSLHFAPGGENVVRIARDAEIVNPGTFASRALQYKSKGPSTLFHARWSDIAKDLGDVQAFVRPSQTDDDSLTLTEFKNTHSLGPFYDPPRLQWHPTYEVASWTSNGYANFFTTNDNNVRRIEAWTGGQLIPSDKGWLRTDRNEVQFFEVSGKPIGKLMFDPYLDKSKPTRPRWKLADGSMATQSGSDGLAISYQQGQRFYCESVDDFERAHSNIKLPRTDVLSKLTPPN